MGIRIALGVPTSRKAVQDCPLEIRDGTLMGETPVEARMNTSDSRDRKGADDRLFDALQRISGQRRTRLAFAGFLSLFFSGCANVQEPPERHPDETKPAPVAAAIALEPQSPLDDFMKRLGDRRSKLLVAGGAGLLIASVVGLGVRKVLRGTTPRAGDWDGQQSPEFESRS